MNATLAGLVDKETNEFIKEAEMVETERPEDIARISMIVKNLLMTSNNNVQISNEKYLEISSSQDSAQRQIAELQDKLELSTGEVALLKHTVCSVVSNLAAVGTSMDIVTKRCDDMNGWISSIVEDCNSSFKDYEDRLIANERSLMQIKDDAAKVLSESNVNKWVIDGIKTLVSAQKDTFRQLTSQQVVVAGTDNTLPANLGTQTVSVPPTPARDQVGTPGIPPVLVGNTLSALIPPKLLQVLEGWVKIRGGILTLLVVIVRLKRIQQLLGLVTLLGITRDRILGGTQ